MSDALFDHITIPVSDLERARIFYTRALAPLGIGERYAIAGDAIGFGTDRPWFWISFRSVGVLTPAHVAFVSPDRSCVVRFHEAALAAGGRDHGAPGLRPDYDDHYYAAFVRDPDGHNIEAVCRRAP